MAELHVAAACLVEVHRLTIGSKIGRILKNLFQLLPLLWKHRLPL